MSPVELARLSLSMEKNKNKILLQTSQLKMFRELNGSNHRAIRSRGLSSTQRVPSDMFNKFQIPGTVSFKNLRGWAASRFLKVAVLTC